MMQSFNQTRRQVLRNGLLSRCNGASEQDTVAHFRGLVTANADLSLYYRSDDSQSTLALIQAGNSKNSALLRAMNTLEFQVYGKIGMMTKMMFSIRPLVAQTLSVCRSGLRTTLATYNALVAIQQSLSSPLEHVSIIEEPFILDDAIGRISPIHLQFVTSWKASDAILCVRFEG